MGPIPMSISAGLTGAMGISFGPHMWLDYEYPDIGDVESLAVDAEPITGHFGAELGIKIRPYASLDVFATAAIDAVVVAAGVKANITLIHASLPFIAAFGAKLDMGVARVATGGVAVLDASGVETGITTSNLVLTLPKVELTFDTRMDLELRTLDGYLSLFAKVDLGFWEKMYEKKLLSWQGPHFSYPLFDYSLPVTKFELGSVAIPLYEYVENPRELSVPKIM